MAIGCHVDHRVAREAVLAIAEGLGVEVWLYEDMPYAGAVDLIDLDRAIERFGDARGLELEPILLAERGLSDLRMRALDIYVSQQHPGFRARLRGHAERLGDRERGVERLWRCRLPDDDDSAIVV